MTRFYSIEFYSFIAVFILKFQTLLHMDPLLDFKLDKCSMNDEVHKKPLIHKPRENMDYFGIYEKKYSNLDESLKSHYLTVHQSDVCIVFYMYLYVLYLYVFYKLYACISVCLTLNRYSSTCLIVYDNNCRW